MTHATGELELDLQVVVQESVTRGSRLRRVHRGRHLCQACGERRAQYIRHGVVKADRTHTLCFECYRAERNRTNGSTLTRAGWVAPLVSPVPSASKLVGDRAGLFAGLELRRRRAQIVARHAIDRPVSTPEPGVSRTACAPDAGMRSCGPGPAVMAS